MCVCACVSVSYLWILNNKYNEFSQFIGIGEQPVFTIPINTKLSSLFFNLVSDDIL